MKDFSTYQSKQLRVTGGIVLGQRGRRPMAVADEEEAPAFNSGTTSYAARKPIPIIGLPVWNSGDETWTIGPVMGRYINQLATAWTGVIPENGSEFYIYEEYSPDLFLSGGSWRRSGKYSVNTAPVIVQRDYGYSDTESRNYTFNSATGVVTQTAIVLTRICVVHEVDGVYYFMNKGSSAPDDPPHFAYTYPTDFDITNQL